MNRDEAKAYLLAMTAALYAKGRLSKEQRREADAVIEAWSQESPPAKPVRPVGRASRAE